MKSTSVLNGLPFCILIAILLVIIYHPITSLGFANMDDDWMLLGDKMVRPNTFNLTYLSHLFTSYNSLQYSPGNTLFYHVVYTINGYDPYWFHLFGLIIHLVNTDLIFLFVKRMLDLLKSRSAASVAYICCLIWAIHPLNVESVIWISASKVLLYTMFTLMALLSMLYFFSSKKKMYYSISLICFIAACFCKEQAIILPVTILTIILIIYLIDRNNSIKHWILACIPFFVVAVVFGIITIKAQENALGESAAASLYPFFDRIIFSFYCLCFYLFNSIIPVNLHYQYDYPIKPGQILPDIYYFFPIAFLFMISCCVYFMRTMAAKTLYLFWFLFFLINISLCIQIIPMRRPAIMADRYMYLPVLGLIVLLIVFIKESFESSKFKGYVLIKKTLYGFGLVYIVSLIIISSQMVLNWQQHNLILK
jgi:hypothetical protein